MRRPAVAFNLGQRGIRSFLTKANGSETPQTLCPKHLEEELDNTEDKDRHFVVAALEVSESSDLSEVGGWCNAMVLMVPTVYIYITLPSRAHDVYGQSKWLRALLTETLAPMQLGAQNDGGTARVFPDVRCCLQHTVKPLRGGSGGGAAPPSDYTNRNSNCKKHPVYYSRVLGPKRKKNTVFIHPFIYPL